MMSLAFFISLFHAQHVSDVNTAILRSLRPICCVISCAVLLWFDLCWCYGVVRLGWCGIQMQAEELLQPASVTQETLSKTHYTLENSRTIGHRSNQYLQKHAY